MHPYHDQPRLSVLPMSRHITYEVSTDRLFLSWDFSVVMEFPACHPVRLASQATARAEDTYSLEKGKSCFDPRAYKYKTHVPAESSSTPPALRERGEGCPDGPRRAAWPSKQPYWLRYPSMCADLHHNGYTTP